MDRAIQLTIVLRESIRLRCLQTRPGAIGMLFSSACIIVTLVSEVPAWRIALWAGPLAAALFVRAGLARSILAQLPDADASRLKIFDRRLRLSSLINQSIAGSGMWSVGQAGGQEMAMFVTLVICLYTVAAMINLASDYRSFRLSLPLAMGQPACYWLLQGVSGFGIVAAILLLSGLMLTSSRRSGDTFTESVLMRYEREALLERVEAQRANVEQALEKANEANRSKVLFLAAASHDLRQPLYAISLLNETLSLQVLPKQARGVVSQQAQAIAVLRSHFDNLLDLSKFEEGRVQPVLGVVALAQILNPLADHFAAACAQQGLQWKAYYPDVTVVTDPNLIDQLLRNLLTNAARFTEQGKVSLTGVVDGGRVRLTVADTGPGIPEAEQARVFEAFVQLDNPQRDRDQGVGLGLAIAQRISSLLGAELSLESQAGAGCRFSLVLPLAQQRVDAAGSRLEEQRQWVPPKNLRVWALDDDPLVRAALSSQFDALGSAHTIVSTRSELTALVDAGEPMPDVAILDDMLGRGENGLDTALWLSRHIPQKRILMVTGNVDQVRVKQIKEAGFVVLHKPPSSHSILLWLAQALDDQGGDENRNRS